MIGFLLRKTLYDLWDNMFKIVTLNIGFVACTAIPIFLPVLVSKFIDSIAVDLVIIAFGILICSLYLSAASFSIKVISDYGNFTFADFIKSFKVTWISGIIMAGFVFLIFMIVTVVIPFYLTMQPPAAGLALCAVIFWTAVFALLSFQFYYTVFSRLGEKPIKSIKKCLLISIDNTGFSVFMFIHNVIALLLSAVLAFMFPGPVGVLLYLDEALRLRLLKYEWLEANPGANRRKIPWDALLIEDRSKTGTRSLRNFIFPWKY